MGTATGDDESGSAVGAEKSGGEDGAGGDEIERVGREVFGRAAFRVGQGEAMRTLVEGHDVLAIMPTGYGKSLIYEVTGTVLGGVTIVISPLIALQEDQVRALSEVRDALPAVALNSSHGAAAERAAWQRIEAGRAGFVFSRPNSLRTRPCVSGCGRCRFRCSWSTRRTACRHGATISGPTT
ncbi:MAG: ATP-dependent helicase RecQ [Subtercola sp.]|nr:ATP-dependent helicase RecQ [Subtercola sp.]